MTPKERARKIIKELEVDGDKRHNPRLFFDDAEDQIECAINAAVEEEREACAKIVMQKGLDYAFGSGKPAHYFHQAIDEIRARSNPAE